MHATKNPVGLANVSDIFQQQSFVELDAATMWITFEKQAPGLFKLYKSQKFWCNLLTEQQDESDWTQKTTIYAGLIYSSVPRAAIGFFAVLSIPQTTEWISFYGALICMI